jgi:hypothetical protein
MGIEEPSFNSRPDERVEVSAEQPLPPYERLDELAHELVDLGIMNGDDLKHFRETCNGDPESALENLVAILIEAGFDPEEYLIERDILE